MASDLESELDKTLFEQLIDNARMLANKKSPLEADFLSAMFSQADEEDLSHYRVEEIAAIAHKAFEAFSAPFEGKHRIEIYDPAFIKDSEAISNQISVICLHNINKPFLVDSILGELHDKGLAIHLVLHPIITLERDSKGKFVAIHERNAFLTNPEIQRESIIQIHVSRINEEKKKTDLAQKLDTILNEVEMVVSDWKAILLRLEETIAIYRITPPPLPKNEIEETVDFLTWLTRSNFAFLGLREYAFDGNEKITDLKITERRGLGLLQNPDFRVLRNGRKMVTITPEIAEFLAGPETLLITKTNVRTNVHRRTYMDYIGVKLFNEQGHLSGELRIVGLFTATTYNRSATAIPYLRRKIARTLEAASVESSSHSGKALMHVLEGYPRDELFQIDEKTLLANCKEILRLQQRPRIRLLSRIDKFDRFVSCLLYIPRDQFKTSIRVKIGDYLTKAYDGHLSAVYSEYPDGPLARVHYIIGRAEGETPSLSRNTLETRINDIVSNWEDALGEAVRQAYPLPKATELINRYCDAFSESYRDTFCSKTALKDIALMESMNGAWDTAIHLYRKSPQKSHCVALKIVHKGNPIPLSQRVPILENMGFFVIDERSYDITPLGQDTTLWMHDMELERADGKPIAVDDLRQSLEECFLAVWYGQAENDGYNRLVMMANLAWRDIVILRSVSRYLRQIRIPYDQDYMWDTLNHYPELAALLVDYFHIRFDPDFGAKGTKREEKEKRRLQECERIHGGILTALEAVSNLDDDRILRKFADVIKASLRTNYYQSDENGNPKPTLSLKLSPRDIEDMPEPKPFREIFVYSPRIEGLHLRFGKVARGGLRWSDRPQDFRTEVLGLVKAQQVKNVVIVPVGSKGGFVPKQLPTDGNREAFLKEGIAAYKLFISSLLDVTDNIDEQKILPPIRVTRHDEDDPYLVVAADKGTASFSDIANSISKEHNFWLDDAFASGGSAGYDHKKMGITARGAWEAVKRHFREMDRDIQTEPFTVTGIGDMSGDVFGNGMLLSKQTRLIAAFDHRDIFIDPDPDPEASWNERKRLFEMGRSSWKDYDAKCISKGGGIFPRSVKSIRLSAAAQKAIGLEKGRATPEEVMKAILSVETDLLWFGGIGTYIRASSETNADAGDRGNDAIRITAKDLKAKVIGEGANLGLTQKARIEFGQLGGRCNSDAIDNSAGVNSSDMEVNIKIALGSALRSGKINLSQRNKLLAAMTDNVAHLVLRNNYLQTLSISLCEMKGMEDLDYQKRLMESLEQSGELDRAVEFLPSKQALKELKAKGLSLTRAEIGVLLAYAKIGLYDALLEGDLPDDPYLDGELIRYFPDKMQKTYKKEIETHRLRREIITTTLTNSMINQGGATLVPRIADKTGANATDIARAYIATRDIFDMQTLYDSIDALDNTITGSIQLALYDKIRQMLRKGILWFLRNRPADKTIGEIVRVYRKGIITLSSEIDSCLPQALAEQLHQEADRYIGHGVSPDLAKEIAHLSLVERMPNIVMLSEKTAKPLSQTARTYFTIAGYFEIGRIAGLIDALEISDYYEGLALDRLYDSMNKALDKMTAHCLDLSKQNKNGFDIWFEEKQTDIEHTHQTIQSIMATETLNVARLTVASGMLSDLAS